MKISDFISLFLFFCLVLSVSAFDFAGTVTEVSQSNGMCINITDRGATEFTGKVEVLLDQSIADLSCFRDKELHFDILGYDILGRPVCNAYFNGMTIQNVYYCGKYPDLCALYGSSFRNELIGRDYSQYYPWGGYYHFSR